MSLPRQQQIQRLARTAKKSSAWLLCIIITIDVTKIDHIVAVGLYVDLFNVNLNQLFEIRIFVRCTIFICYSRQL